MKTTERKRAGWIGAILMFLAVAFSLAAIFRGSPLWLILSAIALAGGLYFLKQYMSSQSLS